MIKRQARIRRIDGVFDEYRAATVALDLLEERLRAEPSFLISSDLRGRVSSNLRSNLELTYFIRLFAEFEAGLREVWRDALKRQTEPPMRDLLDAISGRRKVPGTWVASAHRVRVFRNKLVHPGGADVEPLRIEDSRRHLRRFFSYMPSDW